MDDDLIRWGIDRLLQTLSKPMGCFQGNIRIMSNSQKIIHNLLDNTWIVWQAIELSLPKLMNDDYTDLVCTIFYDTDYTFV